MHVICVPQCLAQNPIQNRYGVYRSLFFFFGKKDLCLFLPGVSTPSAAHSGNATKIHQQVIRPQSTPRKLWWAKHSEPSIRGTVFRCELHPTWQVRASKSPLCPGRHHPQGSWAHRIVGPKAKSSETQHLFKVVNPVPTILMWRVRSSWAKSRPLYLQSSLQQQSGSSQQYTRSVRSLRRTESPGKGTEREGTVTFPLQVLGN